MRTNGRGFILPMTVVLILVLTYSGMSFMQLDYLERRMSGNETSNHGAFYLASAGMERAREVFKIDTTGSPSWSTVLNGTAPAPAPGYTIESPANALLCPDPTKNCIIPPFGAVVTAASVPNFPFDGAFAKGSYSMRAFNDSAESGNVDSNGILTFRSLGNVNNELKLLEADVKAASGLSLITGLTPYAKKCPGSSTGPCPADITGNSTTLLNVDGRDPKVVSTLPTINFTYYSTPSNFPWTSTTYSCTSGIVCSGSTITVNVQNDGFYLIDGLANPATTTVSVDTGGDKRNFVVFSQASIDVQGNNKMTNAIFISLGNVALKGSAVLCAPMASFPSPPCASTPPVTSTMHPAIIAGGSVGGDQGVTIYGDVYALGAINLLPISIHGLLVGSDVTLQGNTLITDDGNPEYYALLPGVEYPPELTATVFFGGGWRELQ